MAQHLHQQPGRVAAGAARLARASPRASARPAPCGRGSGCRAATRRFRSTRKSTVRCRAGRRRAARRRASAANRGAGGLGRRGRARARRPAARCTRTDSARRTCSTKKSNGLITVMLGDQVDRRTRARAAGSGNTKRASQLPYGSCCQLTKCVLRLDPQRVRQRSACGVRRRPQPHLVGRELDRPVVAVDASRDAARRGWPWRPKRPHRKPSRPPYPVNGAARPGGAADAPRSRPAPASRGA